VPRHARRRVTRQPRSSAPTLRSIVERATGNARFQRGKNVSRASPSFTVGSSDAKKIYGGGDTAATEYFKDKTTAIDSYVVGKALDGLFPVLGHEERKIRTNPTARVTDLLKETFGQ
jgi:hypothetical protein